jgi:hypothetical protein
MTAHSPSVLSRFLAYTEYRILQKGVKIHIWKNMYFTQVVLTIQLHIFPLNLQLISMQHEN